MPERLTGLRDSIEHVFIAALIAGFVLVLGSVVNEFDAALKGIGSSLARIAATGI